ncbi:MAG: ABC transporter permease [Euryarchaeota archaeon]|jgi:putative ABC transport system permease protein|nr:ABC transporter permease [Euryarchaeota archaeon]MBT3653444.1 ABC transporter permease [Euryarchaeota archaeon]MBT3758312.1 ABC transporter permease [Euryarchaeota archaeon]MBT4051421.1 ABC transporter permease [Euryarchaeota archaeon]MBT4346692.1 ABC transporter permease [Euryarchaeota archaeon]
MYVLLTKRLARSLWRTKIRLVAVLLIIMVGVFSGIAFGHYAHTASTMYDEIYADTEDGINLPDIWVENPGAVWNGNQADSWCEHISTQWPESELVLNECEARLILDGMLLIEEDEEESKLIPAIWHGIDEGYIDRVWMPEDDCCSGRLAVADDEIVLDAHIADEMEIAIGDTISIGAGQGIMDYTIVGIGFHSNHLYFATPGSILPAEAGTFATGYLSSTGLERLANLSSGSANRLLIDLVGSPDYDLLSTDEVEGVELAELIISIRSSIESVNSTAIVYDRSGVSSVEFLRADAEGAMKSYPVITGMLVIVAGITIFLSLQRLIQSQAKEIAVLRTLGIPRLAIMPGYIIAPIGIGLIGSLFGVILGLTLGAPGMQAMYEDLIGIPVINGSVPYSSIAQIILITMTIVMFSGIRPAWQAANLDPLVVFRGHNEVRLASRAIQKLTARLPTTVGLTIRSSTRKPIRLAFTFFAVGLSMLILGSMLFMMESMEQMMVKGIEDNQNWDSQAFIFPGTEEGVIDWAESTGADFELYLLYPANPEGDSRQLMTIGLDEFATSGNDAMQILNLAEGNHPTAGESTKQVLIDNGIAHFLGWGVGDVQTISFGSQDVEIKIVGITEGEISRTVYFHRSDLAEIVGFEATSVLLKIPEGVSSEGLGEVSVGIVQKQDLLNTFTDLMEKQQGFFVAIQFLGIIVAFVVLFNTLIMNLSERDSELATLRVLGAPISRLSRMMLGEHFAIGLIGGVLGTIFSIIGTKWLMSKMVQWSFYFEIQADLGISLGLTAIVLVISLLLTPIGTYRIKRMDLVEKVKEFSN